jgi:hypothetical protein
MQSIGVLFKERRPKAAYGHLLPQGEKEARARSAFSPERQLHMDIKSRDSSGALLAEGDSSKR